jgi:hypothetical protein
LFSHFGITFYYEHICIYVQKLSLEREVDQMANDMMKTEGWTRSYALSVLRSKFESEERHQEVAYVDDLIKKEAEQQESELSPTANTTTTTTEAEEIPTTTKEPGVTTTISSRKPCKVTSSSQQGTIDPKSVSKQLDKQNIQINKKITQILQPIQKQSQLIRQLQSQLKQLQKQVSQMQKVASIGKKKKNKKR